MPSEFRENAEDLNTADSVQVDVESIRARLDAVPVIVRAVPDGFEFTADGREWLKAVATDLRRLLDENARLNAENERLTIQLHNSKMCAIRELEAQVRGDEAEADRDALAAKLDAVRELPNSWLRSAEAVRNSADKLPGLSKVEKAELKQGAIEMEHCAHQLRNELLAAPEMPRPPAEEEASFRPPLPVPETPSTADPSPSED